MQSVTEIDILGVKQSGILELDVWGWLSRHTVEEFNLAVRCFDHKVKGVILDTREAVISIPPEEISVFTHIMDCPMVYLATAEQMAVTRALIGSRRGFGYRRSMAFTKGDAVEWLDTALLAS